MLETTGRQGKKLSRRYINEMIGRIVKMFRWAAENELIPVTVATALQNVENLQRSRSTARETEAVKPVADAVVDATVAVCPPTLAAMIKIQRLTGMRPGEVCCLSPEMIDRSGEVWIAELPEHKTRWRGKDRLIYLGPQAQEVLKPFLFRSPCFSPQQSYLERGLNRKAKPQYDTQSYHCQVHCACDRAGVERWSPNQLRHAAATAVKNEHGLEAAAVLLGHSRMDVTQVYAEMDRKRGQEIALQTG